MTSSDKKKVVFLVVLLGVAGWVWSHFFRATTADTPGAAGAVAASGKQGSNAVPDARIRFDFLEEGQSAGSAGRRNLFQYYEPPAPKPPESPTNIFTQPPAPPVPPPTTAFAPQVQPFKAFRYEGFSVVSKTGGLLASISEGGNTYTLKDGECLMGQYCVRRLTESLIEIEDLQTKRRQSFPRVQQ